MAPLQPSELPRCVGCGERKQPNELVDGFCCSGRYAQRLPKLGCVRAASAREPLRYAQTLASTLAARDAVSLVWKREDAARKARAKKSPEAA